MAADITAAAADALWGPTTIFVIVFSGVFLSAGCGFFQISGFPVWIRHTLFSLFKKGKGNSGSLSPFQSLTVALAGTMGTGNIVGVAAAITVGGAGAVFWMWTAAIFGMMLSYSENVLGIMYRVKDGNGQWQGGPMAYMERGLGAKIPAVLFAFFCMMSAFGMGNMVQVNSVAHAMKDAFGLPYIATGIFCALVTGVVLLGGLKRVAAFTERLIPALSAVYILACLIVIAAFLPRLPDAILSIIKGAFTPSAAVGGVLGTVMTGIRRGVATNEAGLGSSVMVHSCAETDRPAHQGMWGIFEVFVDTIVVCTLTALVILVSGVADSTSGGTAGVTADGALLSARAFSRVFGSFGSPFVAVSIALFAFSTLIGWSCYGEKCFVYLFGGKGVELYRGVFVGVVVLGSVMEVGAAWDISDILNGCMALINVPAVVLLSPKVFDETRAFVGRKRKKLGSQ